ncbi:MAG: hypothetical protein ACRDJC_20990, partial [Thermomicrobiales bacterium]
RVLPGEPTRVTAESSSRAQRLLIEMLKRELGIDLQLPWEVGPKVVAFTARWLFADYGFHGSRLS